MFRLVIFLLSVSLGVFVQAFSLASDEGERVTKSSKGRLLIYQSDEGKFVCEVFDGYWTIPRFEDRYLKFSTRTALKLKNLFVLRNSYSEVMLGPTQFFGTLTYPHEHAYTIKIDNNGTPYFYRHPKSKIKKGMNTKPLDSRHLSSVTSEWISAKDPDRRMTDTDKNKLIKSSLFPDNGILLTGLSHVKLSDFDARSIDLTEYKAKLVKNNRPFMITPDKEDHMEVITYFFGDQYAERQVEKGNGIFIEKHKFSQTITPLYKNNSGFVILAKEIKGGHDFIGIKIPFGYTLIINQGSFHGDSYLQGLYLMAMTANHKTMSTADTVFIRNKKTKENVSFVMGDDGRRAPQSALKGYPLTLYSGENDQYFNRQLKRLKSKYRSGSIINPMIFWPRAANTK